MPRGRPPQPPPMEPRGSIEGELVCTDPDNPKCDCPCCQAVMEALNAQEPELPDSVPRLAEYRATPDPAVIWAAQKLLRMAESGELRWFYLVAEVDDGGTTVAKSGKIADAARAAGKLHFALQKLTRTYLDTDPDNPENWEPGTA